MIRMLTDILLFTTFLGIVWSIYKFVQFISFSCTQLQRMIFFISGQLKAVLWFLYQWFRKILLYIREVINTVSTSIKELLDLKSEVEMILVQDNMILET